MAALCGISQVWAFSRRGSTFLYRAKLGYSKSRRAMLETMWQDTNKDVFANCMPLGSGVSLGAFSEVRSVTPSNSIAVDAPARLVKNQ